MNRGYSPLTAKSGPCFPIPTSYACRKLVPHGTLFALNLGMSPFRTLLSSSLNRKVRFAVPANLTFHLHPFVFISEPVQEPNFLTKGTTTEIQAQMVGKLSGKVPSQIRK